MKFAVITDIHGNEAALRSVISEIDGMNDIEHIYCLGDMLGIGPDSNEVLDILFSRNDVSMITGNHDEAILAILNGEKHPESHNHARKHHRWIAERIDPIFIPKLQQLPRIIEATIEGRSLFFTHYQYQAGREQEHISKDPFRSIVEPSLENMEALFFNREDEAIFFGHHHPVHFFKNLKTIFLNPGSLGCNDEPTARYGIVNANSEGIHILLKKAVYEKIPFLLSYEKLQVPDRDFILKVFHGYQL
jgi:putative phosphoesterase